MYFYKVPNRWIREKPPDVKKVCTYYLLNETRGISDKGITTIKYIVENSGYKCRTGSDGVNGVYKNILEEAVKQQDILLNDKKQIQHYGLIEGIPYTVNAINFDEIDNFTKLTDTEFDTIIKNNHYKNKEDTLGVYLYIKSYHHPPTPMNRPFGFYQSLDTLERNLNISKRPLIKILDWLVENKLLIKHYVGSRYVGTGSKNRQNVPNIYIPNLGQSQEEIDDTIKSTVKVMKEFYGVDEFLPFMKNLKEN